MNYEDWKTEESGITKEFQFRSYRSAMEFLNKVAEIAEKEKHHPDICLHANNRVYIRVFTHDQNKITTADVKLANLINRIG